MLERKIKRGVFGLWFALVFFILLAQIMHHTFEYDREVDRQTDLFLKESSELSGRLTARLAAKLDMSTTVGDLLTLSIEKNTYKDRHNHLIKSEVERLNRDYLSTIDAKIDVVSVNGELKSLATNAKALNLDTEKLSYLLRLVGKKKRFQEVLYDNESNMMRYYTFNRLDITHDENLYSLFYFNRSLELESIEATGVEIVVINSVGEAFYYHDGQFDGVNLKLKDTNNLVQGQLKYPLKPNENALYDMNVEAVLVEETPFLKVPVVGEGLYYSTEANIPGTNAQIVLLFEAQQALEKVEDEFWEGVNQIVIFIVLCAMVTLLIHYHFTIKEQASIDPLTKLYNRKHFANYTEHLIDLHDREKIETIGIIAIDIDKFKLVNDNYGHDVGDKVLQCLASTMREISRVSDTVYRLGGEEFCIICVGEPLDGMVKFAERLRRAVEGQESVKQYLPNGYTISLGVSIRNQGERFEQVVKRADELLYKAKQSGRNQVQSAWQNV